MKLTTKKASLALASTAALLLAGCASDGKDGMKKMDGDMAKGQCHGVNSCKGKSACATAESSCAGHNSCKGKGWIPSAKADCEAKGGMFKAK